MAKSTTAPKMSKGQSMSEALLVSLAENRIAIEGVTPQIDGGRFPVKRVEGEPLVVEADVFSDGHDKIAAAVVYGSGPKEDWAETPLIFVENDRWSAEISFDKPGPYRYGVIAWRDLYATWRDEATKEARCGCAHRPRIDRGARTRRKGARLRPRIEDAAEGSRQAPREAGKARREGRRQRPIRSDDGRRDDRVAGRRRHPHEPVTLSGRYPGLGRPRARGLLRLVRTVSALSIRRRECPRQLRRRDRAPA